ncbi:MAG: phage Gp37/Gp68 family protein [Pseudomonadota bacterium]
MTKSSIEWTEHTWNPTKGCTIKSPGCAKCYAMKLARRLEAMGQVDYAGTTQVVNGNTVWTGKINLAPEATLLQPLKRKKPTTYFVNSMSDLFHEDIPDDVIDRVFAVMALAPQHTFQVLTKRAARMNRWFAPFDARRADSLGAKVLELGYREPLELLPWPLPNVWLGVSTERQQEYDERAPLLRDTPAAVRFFSMEPLIGPVVAPYLGDWVIVGGESGNGARPMHPDWARSLRDQCAAAGVNFFFKQWGAWETRYDRDQHDPDWRRCDEVSQWPNSQWLNLAGGQGFHGERVVRVSKVGKANAGRMLDGVEYNGMPEARS